MWMVLILEAANIFYPACAEETSAAKKLEHNFSGYLLHEVGIVLHG